MKTTVLFDVGGTLVRYYEREQFPGILRRALAGAAGCLEEAGLPVAPPEQVWRAAQEENHEAVDGRVRPLEERLRRIFALDATGDDRALSEAMRRFLAPIFECAHVYDDTLPVLRQLRRRGLRLATVSNTPWGSPGGLWREEMGRLGLATEVEACFFCTDAGWRKPARPIFDHVLTTLAVTPGECLFVGDDRRWDLAGARGAGIDALTIDRDGRGPLDGDTIRSLTELLPRL